MLVAVLALAGCATGPARETQDDAMALYRAAVVRSAIFDPVAVRTLRPIAESATTVAAVSWVDADAAARFYPPGPMTLARDVWITVEPELREHCAAFGGDAGAVHLRLQQLLGLPPVAQTRTFVAMRVPRAGIFRPCLDPDPGRDRCDRARFPAGSDVKHEAWIAEQMVASWQTDASAPARGFPWTGLGYTFDWNPQGDGVGVSEYVVRKGTTVEVTAKADTVSYCRGAATVGAPAH